MRDLPDVCLEIENSLPLWVGGDLDAEGLRAVEDHLAGCAPCAEKASRARGARAVLREGLARAAEQGGIGADPWPRLRASLRSEGFLREAGESRLRLDLPRRGPSLLRWATAAAVLLAFVFAWGKFPGGSGAVKDPSPASIVPVSDEMAAGTPSRGLSSTPVEVKPAGLRHLSPNERRLRDTAQFFFSPEDLGPAIPLNRLGSPAGLERSTGAPPR